MAETYEERIRKDKRDEKANFGRIESELKQRLQTLHKRRTAFVPRVDFEDVLNGRKREWRIYGAFRLGIEIPVPSPVVIYTPGPTWESPARTGVMTLTKVWVEPLGAITPESLALEGFDNLSDFRRYFEKRYPDHGYRPTANVIVRQVEPVTEGARYEHMWNIWWKLYGCMAHDA